MAVQVLNIVLNFSQRLTDLLTDPVEMNLCSESSVLGINSEMWSDVKLALVECLKPLSLICSGLGSAKNHEYLWLICYIAQRREFCHSSKVLFSNYLLLVQKYMNTFFQMSFV